MRSLLVTKFVPQPANSGGRLRSWAILQKLAERGPVTLCAFDDGQCDVSAVERLGVTVRTVRWHPGPGTVAQGVARTASLSSSRFWSAELASAIRAAAAIEPLDVLQVEYLQMARYASDVFARFSVLDLHNVESQLTADHGRRRGFRGLPYRLEGAALRRLERRALARFDLVTVVSERDRSLLSAGASERPPLVCPNGWRPRPELPPSDSPTVGFTAALGWGPNVDAACWFAREVWPRVAAAVGGARLLLVGRDPAPAVIALGGPTIEVVGTVPDVEPYLQQTRVAVAPLLAGGGSRLKILEALSAGRPVVSTTAGASGLEDLVDTGILVADEPDEFADRVVELLRHPEAGEALGRLGRAAVRARYSWDTTLAPWEQRLDALVVDDEPGRHPC